MKKILIIIAVLLFTPSAAFAYNTVTADDSLMSFSLSDTGNTYTLGLNSRIDSFTVNSGSIELTAAANSMFVITSSDRNDFSIGGSNCTLQQRTCSSSESSITVDCLADVASHTITITPSGTCSSDDDVNLQTAGGGGSSGGGGGGGGSSSGSSESSDEPAAQSVSFKIGSPVILNLAPGVSHKATVSSATDPIDLTLAKNESKDLDTDSDGKNDLRVLYQGLDNGKPKLVFTVIAVDKDGDAKPVLIKKKVDGCALDKETAYKHSKSRSVYYVTKDCTKRAFKNPKIFFTYFDSWGDVKVADKTTLEGISDDELDFMPWGPKFDPQYGALVKVTSDPKVYLLLGTTRYWITSEDVFNTLKYSWNWIEDIADSLLAKYTEGSEITDTTKHPDHTLVKYKNDPKTYKLEDGKKRHIKVKLV